MDHDLVGEGQVMPEHVHDVEVVEDTVSDARIHGDFHGMDLGLRPARRGGMVIAGRAEMPAGRRREGGNGRLPVARP